MLKREEVGRSETTTLSQSAGLNCQKPSISVLSFIPEKNRVKYPHIKPGIYIFVQDRESNEVFLWNSNSGHGHPFLASLVNRSLKREDKDFSWVGAAGEIVFGEEILALSFCTGFFHKTLKLTEPEEGNYV